MIDQQPRDKNKPFAAVCLEKHDVRSGKGRRERPLLFGLFMTLEGEIKNNKINTENGRGAS